MVPAVCWQLLSSNQATYTYWHILGSYWPHLCPDSSRDYIGLSWVLAAPGLKLATAVCWQLLGFYWTQVCAGSSLTTIEPQLCAGSSWVPTGHNCVLAAPQFLLVTAVCCQLLGSYWPQLCAGSSCVPTGHSCVLTVPGFLQVTAVCWHHQGFNQPTAHLQLVSSSKKPNNDHEV